MRVLLALFFLFSGPAAAQEVNNDLPKDSDFFCQLVVGNLQGQVQEAKGLYLDIYAVPTGDSKSIGRYGLLTGTYEGSKGVSHFGPTLDDPKSPRFYKDGTPASNADAAFIRSHASEFRKTKCGISQPKEN